MNLALPAGTCAAVELAERLFRDAGGTDRPITSLHLGTSPVLLGEICDAVHLVPHLVPRTCHLGDWRAIAECRAGALDFNTAVCGAGFGHPSIHAFTMTETADEGDRVYRPGTIFEGNRPVRLTKLTWDGQRFVERPDGSFLCPLVLADHGGRRVPLVELHKRRWEAFPFSRFHFEASALLHHEERLRAGLTVLLEAAAESGSRRATALVIGKVVALNGTPLEKPFDWREGVLSSDEAKLGSPEDVAAAAILALKAVDDPDRFFSQIAAAPLALPILSSSTTMLFAALFQSKVSRGEPMRGFHFHWGARDMAGYPPDRLGYFMTPSNQQKMLKIARVLSQRCDWFIPLHILLLPASVFMLAPVDRDPADLEAIDGLLETILSSDHSSAAQLASLTQEWFDRVGPHLSAYFKLRFNRGSGIPDISNGLSPGTPSIPEKLMSIPISTLCMLVGLLHKLIRENQ